MSITITTDDVKRKCMISDSTYDSDISALISETQPAIEKRILSVHLDNTGDTDLQALLKLGMLELICAEFLEQLRREPGATEFFEAGKISIGKMYVDGEKLGGQGAERLAPYLADAHRPWTDSFVIPADDS